MKKILAILSILLLTFGMAFGATQTATVTLNATVSETALNSGLRVRVGDLTGSVSTYGAFDNVFNNANSLNAITIGTTEEISLEPASGYFTVMVKRPTNSPITVSVNADPMQRVDGAPYYLGFKITKKGETTSLINTTSSPSTPVSGLSYTANNVYSSEAGIRNYRVFEYEIPQNITVPLGKYETNIYFSITTT